MFLFCNVGTSSFFQQPQLAMKTARKVWLFVTICLLSGDKIFVTRLFRPNKERNLKESFLYLQSLQSFESSQGISAIKQVALTKIIKNATFIKQAVFLRFIFSSWLWRNFSRAKTIDLLPEKRPRPYSSRKHRAEKNKLGLFKKRVNNLTIHNQ